VDVLRSGKAHERRPKASPRPERETIYDLRSRLAGIREKVARLEAERRRLAQATAEQRAQHQAEVREVLLQVATLERDLLEAERDRATLLGALEAQQAAHMRGATLIGSSLAISGLTLAAIPAKYAWMGYTVAAGLALWGLFEFILPVGRQSANGAEPAGGPAKEEALAH
jgi:predicted RNase H-like nuclease (RuvC/YqgF family)